MDELNKTVDEVEQEVIDELGLEYDSDDNPCKLYSVIFPYQIRFTLPDDDHNTEVIINTKSEEFYTARNKQDILFQRELSDRYSKITYTKRIKKYVREELWEVEPEDGHFIYKGKPEITELLEERLSTFEREVGDTIDD